MPTLRHILLSLVGIAVLLVLVRIEVLLVRDLGGRRARVLTREKLREYGLVAANIAGGWLTGGGTVLLTTFLVNMAGGGLIHLRSDGWRYLPSFLVMIVAFDLAVYFGHRAYHKLPPLWSIHSLHHSAEELSATTGGRHFWLQSISDAVILSFLGMLVQAPADILLPISALNYFNGALSHFDVPVPLGRFILVFNNPQWHRIHHSALPQHRDKNFANFFPIIDVIFGTAWIPAHDEFPATGLDNGDKPRSVSEGLIWPLRHVWRRRRSARFAPTTVAT